MGKSKVVEINYYRHTNNFQRRYIENIGGILLGEEVLIDEISAIVTALHFTYSISV